jgi:hypothetical protein
LFIPQGYIKDNENILKRKQKTPPDMDGDLFFKKSRKCLVVRKKILPL